MVEEHDLTKEGRKKQPVKQAKAGESGHKSQGKMSVLKTGSGQLNPKSIQLIFI